MVSLLKTILVLNLLFWDINFIPYTKHISLLAKKLGFTTRHVNNKVIKERIRVIWQNKTVTGLDILFTANPDWWVSTAIIYALPAALCRA